MFGRIKTKLRNNAKGAKYLFTNLGWTNWQTFLYGEKCSSARTELQYVFDHIRNIPNYWKQLKEPLKCTYWEKCCKEASSTWFDLVLIDDPFELHGTSPLTLLNSFETRGQESNHNLDSIPALQ